MRKTKAADGDHKKQKKDAICSLQDSIQVLSLIYSSNDTYIKGCDLGSYFLHPIH